MTKIEEVARAMRRKRIELLGHIPAGETDEPGATEVALARAAIEAMWEPTEAMVDAFVREGHGKTVGDVGVNGWRAMIDAVLSEGDAK